MTSSKSDTAMATQPATSDAPHPENFGLFLLALALLFNAILLAPELRIERAPVNDLPFHIGAAQVLGHSIAHGEPFMDPWVSQWSLGFPLWRIYQPLPHLLAAGVIALCHPFASAAASFAALYYLLLVLVPASTYLGTRLLGLSPIAAGLASILILAPNEMGDLGRYGLSYGAYLWRGSGLYTELVALQVMLIALGLVSRAIDAGRQQTAAAIALALTALCHVFFGYVAFVSIAVWALAGPSEGRAQRLARTASIAARAMLLLAWFIIPMMMVSGEVNRSRWEPSYKFDSYGAAFILRQLVSGNLLDFGRAPVLTLMAALGALIAVFKINDSLARRLLVLVLVWLALFFGRETWGYLLYFAGIPSQFHVHRLEAAFELFVVLIAGWGLERVIAAALRAPALIAMAAGVVLGAAILVLAMERAEFLRLNTMWGEKNLAAFERERGDLDAALADIRAIITERPGRVSAGKAEDWGWTFKIGDAHVYDFLSSNAIDQASYLFHTIPVSSDYMVLRSENNPAQEDFFAVRAVLAPITLRLPSNFKRRSTHGRFVTYEASPEGYFSLGDIGARYDGPRSTWFDLVSLWVRSRMLRGGELVALDSQLPGVPVLARGQPLPDPSIKFMSQRGRILSESRVDQAYRASVDIVRPCYAFIKITYFPGQVARVDGNRVPLVRVAPDFGAFPLSPGHHEVEVRYEPGLLKPLLFIAGIALFVLAVRRRSFAAGWERGEDWLRARLEVVGAWLTTDRIKIALALAVLILLFTRALFRGYLLDGHDAMEYPPRLAEFAKAIGGGRFPPVWAPDLSNGHGQPLFEFAPPLPYLMALPFFECGFKLADSLQFGLAILFAIGAIAVYLIGRRLSFSPIASIGVAAAWLFAPYQALDMYVSVRMAEASAIAIAPVALLGLLTALDRPTIASIALGAVALALVPLGHNAVALLIFPVFAAIVVVRSLISERPLQTAAAGSGVLAGGLGLSAFFWLPALLEKDFVKTELLRDDFLNWSIHIISPWQLFWGRWGFGYSVAGPNDGISFSLGLIHIALAIAGAVIGIRALNRTRRSDALVFVGATLAAAWLATDWSAPLWEHVPTLQYLAYPWRTLSVCALLMPILALYVFDRIGAKLTIVVIGLILIVNLHHTQPKGFLTYDEEFYYPASIAQHGINTTTREEYEPRWVQARLKYTGDGILTPTPLTAVRALSWTPTSHEYAVTAPALSRVMDSTTYYPGWTVLIDGQETSVSPSPIIGTLSFLVPSGNHTITIEFRPTPVRRFASIISIVALAILLLGFVVARFYPSSRWVRRSVSILPPGSGCAPAEDSSDRPEAISSLRRGLGLALAAPSAWLKAISVQGITRGDTPHPEQIALPTPIGALGMLAVAALLLLHVSSSIWSASRESPTYDETTIIPGGYARLMLHDYRLTPVAAPLMPMLAGLAISPFRADALVEETAWKNGDGWNFGYSFLYGQGQGRRLVWRARLPFVALSAILGLAVFFWARQLWGTTCGYAALFLYALNPELLAHSHYANLDLAISLVATLALWAVWNFLRSPTFGHGVLAATALAIAPVTKYSFPLVFLMAAVMALASLLDHLLRRDHDVARRVGGRLLMLTATVAIASWLVVWTVFGFKAQNGATPALSYPPPVEQLVAEGPLRVMLVAARDHRLLPDAFVDGIANTIHLPQTTQMSFLFGQVKSGGWWYYFPLALLLKAPLPLLLLLLSTPFIHGPHAYARPALVALALPAAVYLALAMGFRFNIGYRHLLPLLPLLCIWGGRQATSLWCWRGLRPIVLLLFGWYALGTWLVAPHFLSFFNELAGGPKYGYHYLADSNCDWGQDLEELARLCQRLGLQGVKFSYFGTASPDEAGVPYIALPRVACCWLPRKETMTLQQGDVVAVSVTNLMGVYARGPGAKPLLMSVDFDGKPRLMPFVDVMAYLDKHYRPFARAGYSILLYRLEPRFRI